MRIYLKKTNSGQYRLTAALPQSPGKISNPEALLKALSKATEISVIYSPELSEQKAREIFRQWLSAQTRKHRRWMLTDSVLLPFSIPLTLVPGPNLVLFYLAWRAWSHYQSQKGGRHALYRLPQRFEPAGA